MNKVIRGAKVPRSASVCDENLTRLTPYQYVARHGARHAIKVRDGLTGRWTMRYVTDAELESINAESGSALAPILGGRSGLRRRTRSA